MQHQNNKITKIVAEVSMYLFNFGATQVDSRVTLKENQATITLVSDYDPIYTSKFTTAFRLLSTPRDEALEDEFWSLAGSTDMGEASQLLLVGAMTDSANIDITKDVVTIVLTRKL
ncbi:MAG: hypothetical protein RR253_00880 [Oscillospiraceae bacterium]